MKALVYPGPRPVQVEEVPDATIQHSRSAVVRVTTTTICGSDMLTCTGRTDAETDAHDYRRLDDREDGWTTALLRPAS